MLAVTALAGLVLESRATDIQWQGGTASYTIAADWVGGVVPGSSDNAINDQGANTVVEINSGDANWGVLDIRAGNGAGDGAFVQNASTVTINGWFRLGINTAYSGAYTLNGGTLNYLGGELHIGEYGTAVFNLNGGTITGSGNFAVNNGSDDDSASGAVSANVGTLNQNAGVINVTGGGQFFVGNRGTGVYNLAGGSLTVDNYVAIGRSSGTGTLNMTGGTLAETSSGCNFLLGTGWQNNSGAACIGVLNQSGGSITCQGQFQCPENSPGTGTYNLSGTGSLLVNNWLAIGRDSGTGLVTMDGGSITKTGTADNHFTIGSGGEGTLIQTNGVITNSVGDFWLGQSAAGTWTIYGGAAYLPNLVMAVNDTATATLNLNGGLLQASSVTSPSTVAVSILNLNGGTVQASGNTAAFIQGISQASVGGAVTIDSQSYDITIPQDLQDNGGGSLIKTGTGSLTLSGANSYSGGTTVNAGVLNIYTGTSTSGSYTIADAAALKVYVQSAGGQTAMNNFTLGGAAGATLTFDLGAFGNPSSSQAPIAASGTLTQNGTTLINISDSYPQVGQLPLIQYGSLAGVGNFVVGSLPVGVAATIVTNSGNNSIDLVFTSVNQPRWDGQAGGTWDTGSDTNWVNIGTGLGTSYTDPSTVRFDDSAAGTTTVEVSATVNPLNIAVTNNSLNYTWVGTGKISGSGGLVKSGTGSLTVLTANNDYTGPTILAGGTLSVTNLAADGVPSPIGAGSLVLAGGNLNYSGPAKAITRSYSTTNGSSTITTVSNLTLSGTMTAGNVGGLTKAGFAQLTYATAGINVLSGAGSGGYIVSDGAVVFNGSNGGQNNVIGGGNGLEVDGLSSLANVLVTNATLNITNGNIGIGNVANATGTLTIDGNSTVNLGSWLIFDNGGNALATLTLNSGTLNVPNGKVLMGGAPGGISTLNINGGALTNSGGNAFDIGDGDWNGSGVRTGIVNQTAGTLTTTEDIYVGYQTGGIGFYNLSGGTINEPGWLMVGRGSGSGTFNMTGGTINKTSIANDIDIGTGSGSVGIFNQSGGTLNSASEFWTAEGNGAIATNNISGSAVLNIHNWVTIGRQGLGVVNMTGGQFNSDTQPFIVGIWSGSQGIWNQSAGALNVNADLYVGEGSTTANGVFNLTGGTVTNTGWLVVGRESAQGTLNISGGTMVKAGTGGNVDLAHNSGASGTVNISGTGTFICQSGETWIGENAAPGVWNMNGGTAILGMVRLAENADATGVMTLNGGSLTATEITTGNTGAAKRELDFNGGTLVAGGNNSSFIHDLSAAVVETNGAIFNTAGYTVSVNQALLGGNPDGGLTKNGNGALYLNGANTYTNTTVVNAGQLGGTGSLLGPVTVAAGATIGAGTSAIGTLTIGNTLGLATGSQAFFKLAAGTNDQIAGLTGVSYAGALVVSNTTSASLGGSVFKLFSSASAGTGNFASVTVLPAGSGVFNPATGELIVPGFHPATLSDGKILLTGVAGLPGSAYTMLTSTNVALPLGLWQTNSTGNLDGTGAFSAAIPVSTAESGRFFRVRVP